MNLPKKSLIIALLLTVTATVLAQTFKYETVANDPMGARIYTLDNGLKIYLSRNTEKPRIQTYIAVRTGSRNDPHETTGLAHYLEHLMFKGTTHFGTSNLKAEQPLLDSIEHRFEVYRTIKDPAARKAYYQQIDSISQLAAKYNIPNEYDKMMSAIGSEGSNAYTSNDVTCYEENIPSNEIDTWAKVQGDRFQNMVIRGFHTELEAVYEEYNINMASDGTKTYTAFLKKLCPSHPYGTQSTIGTQEHLKNPSITNIKNYFHKYYEPNNIAICMSGDLDYDKTVATINKYFGSWKGYGAIDVPQYAPQPVFTTPQDTTVIGQESERLMMGWRFDRGNTLQGDTLDIINNMLWNGNAGLFDLDLIQKMKIQDVRTYFEPMHDYSFYLIMAMPKEGQTLDNVRHLILNDIDKLKKGDFDEKLIKAVMNNYKRHYYEQLDHNDFRADAFVNAFINEIDWRQQVNKIARMEKITKSDIVAFANRYFTDGYACVFKIQGNDTTLKKVEKPHITPIPTNNDKHSEFLEAVVSAKPTPIQPSFVDFKKDLTASTTGKGLPIVYKQNTDNDLFTLSFRIPFGAESNPLISYAAGYLNYLGTSKMTAEEIKQQFYELACDYYISEDVDETTITLTGLNSNMPQALRLLNDLMMNAKPDKDAYTKYLGQIMKNRADSKSDQDENFNRLESYAVYGSYNPMRSIPSEETLKNTDPQSLLDLIKGLPNYKQTVLYYGPSTLNDVSALIGKTVKTPKHFAPMPAAKPFKRETTDKKEVLLAPYDAPNIYMVQYFNEQHPFSISRLPIVALFNQYFGSGMNAIVFQELREARGLAYSAGARYYTPTKLSDSEHFMTFIICQSDKMMDCITEFNSLLNNTPEREAGFNLAKQSLQKSLASARTTKFAVLERYMEAKKLGIDVDTRKIVYDALPSMQLSDVIKFAKENIADKTYKYVILGKEENLDMKSLQKIAPITKLSTEDIFGY